MKELRCSELFEWGQMIQGPVMRCEQETKAAICHRGRPCQNVHTQMVLRKHLYNGINWPCDYGQELHKDKSLNRKSLLTVTTKKSLLLASMLEALGYPAGYIKP